MTIVILLLVCCTRICTDCFFLSISLLFDILYKLRFDNFLLNEDDDDDDDDDDDTKLIPKLSSRPYSDWL